MEFRTSDAIRARREGRVLTEEQLRAAAPSVFAETPHDSRSRRYALIPTKAVIDGLAGEGFLPVAARQARPRDASRTDFTKHMLRFRRDGEDYSQVGDVIPELVLVNSHDGSSSYRLMAGLFRLVCLNGMVVDDGLIASVRITHTGDIVGRVIEAAHGVVAQSAKSLAAARAWSGIELAPPERHALAKAAHVLRFGDADGETKTPIAPEQLLRPRRYGDDKADLWTTFNVLQENAIRGGQQAFRRDGRGRRRRVTARPVQGIDQDLKLNKALWVLAGEMATLKGHAPARHSPA